MSKELKKLIDIERLKEFKSKLDEFESWPAGVIIPFAGTSVPTGCLLCNGAQVSKTDYSNLYDVIGDKFSDPDYHYRVALILDVSNLSWLKANVKGTTSNVSNSLTYTIDGGNAVNVVYDLTSCSTTADIIKALNAQQSDIEFYELDTDLLAYKSKGAVVFTQTATGMASHLHLIGSNAAGNYTADSNMPIQMRRPIVASDDTMFLLPDLRGRVLQGASGTHSTGSYIAAGLPNISGGIYNGSAFYCYGRGDGAFSADGRTNPTTPITGGNACHPSFSFNAQRSNALYGASNTVQMAAVATNFIIKY